MHQLGQLVVIGSLAHDEGDLHELALLAPSLEEQERRDGDHLEHRQAEHGAGGIADRDEAQPCAQAALPVELGVHGRSRDGRRRQHDARREACIVDGFDVEVLVDHAGGLERGAREDRYREADDQDHPGCGSQADDGQDPSLAPRHLAEVDRRRPAEGERGGSADRLPGEQKHEREERHGRSVSKRRAGRFSRG